MLLAIDVGNTNINFGILKGQKIIRRFNIPTHGYSYRKLKMALKSFLCHCERPKGAKQSLDKDCFVAIAPRNDTVNDSIICSVVPRVTVVLAKDLTKLLGKTPYIIGKDIKVPIKNCYANPKEVGSDRLVSAYAGIQFYGAPLIIIDFGTAVTFDLVSKNKAYLGGLILPGLQLSLDALAQRTALLPKVKLGPPKKFIGQDTRGSMLSGIVYGFASLTDKLVERIKLKLGGNIKVIATGGNARLISKYSSQIKIKDPDLIFKGMRLIYEKKIVCVK